MSTTTPTMMAIHAAALSAKIAAYHEFLSRYSKKASVVYGFVEGKTDPSFYQGFIEQLLPSDWQCELWPAGNKEQVYRIHRDIDWRRFPKTRVCFFVDRDLTDLIPEKVKIDKNIFVTDGYSIENDVVRRGTCRRLLTEVFGLHAAIHDELDQVCDMFEVELEKFFVAMIPIMAWVLLWRRTKQRANLNDIAMRDLFVVGAGRLNALPRPRGKATLVEYIHEKCGVKLDPAADIASHEAEVRRTAVYRRFTRGKFVFWFMVEFCRSVHSAAVAIFPSLLKVPKINVTVSSTNGMTIVGNRARIPNSLRAFIANTFTVYVTKHSI